jgi:hypothetical protein
MGSLPCSESLEDGWGPAHPTHAAAAAELARRRP